MKILEIHELLDRTHIINCMFNDFIYDVIRDEKVPDAIRMRSKTIAHDLGELYQMFGEYHAKSLGSR